MYTVHTGRKTNCVFVSCKWVLTYKNKYGKGIKCTPARLSYRAVQENEAKPTSGKCLHGQ